MDDKNQRVPNDLKLLQHLHKAIYDFSRQLRNDIDDAIGDARGRRLGMARSVAERLSFLIQRHTTGDSDELGMNANVSADVAAASIFVNMDKLLGPLERWADAISKLEFYEGQRFARRPIILDRSNASHRPRKTEPSDEAVAIASMTEIGPMLVRPFNELALKLETPAASEAAKPVTERAPGDALSTKQVAEQLSVGTDKVLSWIKNGKLKAANVASVGSSRPRYRIAPEELAAFVERQSAGKEQSAKPKRKAPAATREYL